MTRARRVVALLSIMVAAPLAAAPPPPAPAPPARASGAPMAPEPSFPPGPLTLDQAMRYAVEHYPSVRAALERVNSSAAGVSVARSSYLPRFESTLQSNLATTNNVFGQVLPQSVIPALTGPALPAESDDMVYGSAVGVLLSWQPFDFGRRKSMVIGAEATLDSARAAAALTRLEVQGAVGAAFLDVLAAERAALAAGADLERREVLARTVETLVDNQLRPGAEASHAAAERAASRTRLIQAQATAAVARTTLARVLGTSSGDVMIDAAGLVEELPPPGTADPADSAGAIDAAAHPLAVARQAEVEVARSEVRTVTRDDLPQIVLQSSAFARGSGAAPDGTLDSSTDGLGLDRENWAIGMQIRVPDLFAFASSGARKAVVEASAEEAAARYDETLLAIHSQRAAAAALVVAAREVAENTPIQLEAAREGETRARARFEAGLASLLEAAEAQSLLAEAEVQDEIARVDVWRALLQEAVARGDVDGFLDLLPPPATR